jgi:YidC/Oxa1 family membrane protein insertase
MFDVIATVLDWFYSLVHSYGGAIMLLTLAIMILLTPLTLKGTRSMIALQRLQPELKKLQNRYKDDRQKLNEEMLKFYKEHGINPVGGCLPLLVQMPVFIVLYRVLYGLTQQAPFGLDMGRAAATAAANGPSAVFEQFGTFQPSYLDPSSELATALSRTREMRSFGIDLAQTPSAAIAEGFLHGLPYLLLLLVVGLSSWYQQRQVQGRNPNAQINPQQQMIMKVLPFFLPVFSFTLPAGVVLYFVVSNGYRILQQAFITRTMYAGGTAGPIDTTGTDTTSTRPSKGEAVGPGAPRKGLLAGLASLREQASEAAGRAAPARSPKASEAKAKATDKDKKATGAKATDGKAGGKSKAKVSTRSGPSAPTGTAKPAANGAKTGGRGTGKAGPAASKDKAASGATSVARSSGPSRRPPSTNPNRSRSKKKRR